MNAPVPFAEQTGAGSRRRAKKAARLARIARWMNGHVLETEALQALLEQGDAVALEGDNQKQADFLARSLV
jgi:malonate decarboxylase alpha subunit